MDEPQRDSSVPAIVNAITSRTVVESDRLAWGLLHTSWPGGTADRHRPSAVDWVLRWGPSRLAAEPLPCSCPRGHCAVCN